MSNFNKFTNIQLNVSIILFHAPPSPPPLYYFSLADEYGYKAGSNVEYYLLVT